MSSYHNDPYLFTRNAPLVIPDIPPLPSPPYVPPNPEIQLVPARLRLETAQAALADAVGYLQNHPYIPYNSEIPESVEWRHATIKQMQAERAIADAASAIAHYEKQLLSHKHPGHTHASWYYYY
jgi:hypothetical protein